MVYSTENDRYPNKGKPFGLFVESWKALSGSPFEKAPLLAAFFKFSSNFTWRKPNFLFYWTTKLSFNSTASSSKTWWTSRGDLRHFTPQRPVPDSSTWPLTLHFTAVKCPFSVWGHELLIWPLKRGFWGQLDERLGSKGGISLLSV